MFHFHELPSMLEERTLGDFSLRKYTVTSQDVRALIEGIPRGEYIKLVGHGTVLMSNTPMEIRTNHEFFSRAHGDVLIGGLGLGIIIMKVQDDPRINSITVVEKEQEVIDLVASQLPFNEKVKIVHDDIFTHVPENRYDIIYIDIWPYINSDVYNQEMKPLKRRYLKYLKPKSESPDRKVFCWAEREAKSNSRLF